MNQKNMYVGDDFSKESLHKCFFRFFRPHKKHLTYTFVGNKDMNVILEIWKKYGMITYEPVMVSSESNIIENFAVELTDTGIALLEYPKL